MACTLPHTQPWQIKTSLHMQTFAHLDSQGLRSSRQGFVIISRTHTGLSRTTPRCHHSTHLHLRVSVLVRP